MTHHLVLGAGGVGRTTTAALVALGHTVTLASRSGLVAERPWEATRPDAVEVVSADAGDTRRVTELARGATSIVNAVNPPSYMTWDTDWPPVAAATLAAAEATGAGLVIIGNLYGYGRVHRPMREDDPLRPSGRKGALRADMWTEALARHLDGRLRVTELRSSDYFGPGTMARTSYLNDIVIDSLLAGRTPFLPVGRRNAPHSWTYVPDVGALAARVATSSDVDVCCDFLAHVRGGRGASDDERALLAEAVEATRVARQVGDDEGVARGGADGPASGFTKI